LERSPIGLGSAFLKVFNHHEQHGQSLSLSVARAQIIVLPKRVHSICAPGLRIQN